MKAKIWLVLKKLNGPADAGLPGDPADRLARQSCQDVFSQQNVLSETIAWAVPCLSGRGRPHSGRIFSARSSRRMKSRDELVFVARKGGRSFAKMIDLEGAQWRASRSFFPKTSSSFPRPGKDRNTFSSFLARVVRWSRKSRNICARVSPLPPSLPQRPRFPRPSRSRRFKPSERLLARSFDGRACASC